MAIALDIFRSWVAPRAVMRRRLAAGVREDRALAVLMGAALLLFVAQWPFLARAAYLQPEVPFEARMAGAALACLFLLPLFCYAIAFVSHLIARLAGGRGSGYSARLALFWSLLAVSPAMLFQGLAAGFIGPGPTLNTIGAIVLIGFFWLWISALIEAETAT